MVIYNAENSQFFIKYFFLITRLITFCKWIFPNINFLSDAIQDSISNDLENISLSD